MATSSDNFNRADNTDLGANWDVQTSEQRWQVLSNQAQPEFVANDSTENWNANSFGADQFSEAAIVSTTGGNTNGGEGIGVACRCSAAARTYYRCVVNSAAAGNVEVAKMVATVYTSLAHFTSAFAANDVLRLELLGTGYTVKKNGASIGTGSDSAIASGRVGISFSSVMTTGILDNWQGGDLSAAATSFLPYSPVSAMMHMLVR